MATMRKFDATVIEEFRANGGKVGGHFEGAPMARPVRTRACQGGA